MGVSNVAQLQDNLVALQHTAFGAGELDEIEKVLGE
jgi:aryl-alcohol dehydrogenase-like predicted oxidoreductase